MNEHAANFKPLLTTQIQTIVVRADEGRESLFIEKLRTLPIQFYTNLCWIYYIFIYIIYIYMTSLQTHVAQA